MTDFDEITAGYEDDMYITVSTKELTLQIIPFYSLPARTVAALYSRKNNQEKFIKDVYKVINVSMKNPEQFKQKVYDTGVTYTGLIEFLNSWISISSLIQKFESGEIDSNGNRTNRSIITNVDIIQNMILEKLAKGEEVKTKMLIRYLSEQIRELAVNFNSTADKEDIIYEVRIPVPIGEEIDYEF